MADPLPRLNQAAGQEKDDARDEIIANPPDILLTNYVMLELLLTRPHEKRLIEAGRGLKFLVLDELHTYRGRQGSDVALLVRRVKEAMQADALQYVGTSATLAGGGTLEEQKKELDAIELPGQHKEEQGYVLPELFGAIKGRVVMRLAPYPSGPLHLGRARMAILNDEYVKRYAGKLILVVDDTAGSAEKIPIAEAYESFPRDLGWLGIEVQETVYKSDRLEIFYSYARQFIEEGWAYVCTCRAEDLRRNRSAGKECACRRRSASSNMEEWERMLSGEYSEGEAAVRLRTDMSDPDLAFRDRVLLRISERPHPRVGPLAASPPDWVSDQNVSGSPSQEATSMNGMHPSPHHLVPASGRRAAGRPG